MPNLFLNILLIYLFIINFIAIIATIHDKHSAIHRKWRVRESTLILISVLGGSVAMLFTMLAIRHKTRHIKFMLGIPLIILAQMLLAFAIWRLFYV